jgi:Concanavalin A-like lectin/glucanases superfamily/Right handed beta helix region
MKRKNSRIERRLSVSQVYIIGMLAFVWMAGACFGATWYVRPDDGAYGNEDGTSYNDAFDGFSDIVWGSGGVEAGDTLYICGTHLSDKMAVGASGSSGSPITIRGDYASDPGVIDGSEDVKSETWTMDGAGKWYYANGYSNYVLINDKFCKQVDDLADMDTAGEWYYSNPNVYIYSASDPSTNAAYSSIRVGHWSREYGIKIDGKSYITVQAVTFKRIETRKSNYATDQGAILLNDSPHCIVKDNHVIQCGRSIMVAGESDYAVVEDNLIEKQFARLSSVYRYSRSIFSVSNNVTIRRNTIDALITFYDDSTLRAGCGIDLQIHNYPDYYCYQTQVYRNEVSNVDWWGIRCQQMITNTGIREVDLHIYENYVYDSYQAGDSTGEEDGIAAGCNEGDADNHFTGINIYRNIIKNFANTGVSICNYWDDSRIYENLIIRSGGHTAEEGGAGIYLSSRQSNCDVYNNTIYDSYGDAIVIWKGRSGGDGYDIRNNIISGVSYNQNGHGKAVYVGGLVTDPEGYNTAVTGGYNCFYDIDGDPDTVNFTNTNGTTSDSLFADASNGDFRLLTNSPCKNTGDDVDIETDIEGNPVDANPDMGCYEVIDDAVELYLKLDDGSGLTALDETDNENDGTLTGLDSGDAWVAGYSGDAVEFNGSWSERIDCGNDASLMGHTEYSLSVWVNLNSDTFGDSNRNIIMNYDGSGPEGYLLRVGSSDTISFAQCSDGAVWNANLHVSTDYPHDDEWHHVAVTFTYSGGVATSKLYLDGVLVDTGTDTCTPDFATTDCNFDIGSGIYDGAMDEVRMYSRALTAKQIWNLAKSW